MDGLCYARRYAAPRDGLAARRVECGFTRDWRSGREDRWSCCPGGWPFVTFEFRIRRFQKYYSWKVCREPCSWLLHACWLAAAVRVERLQTAQA